MIRTILQIIIFISAMIVGILCFLQANKGQSVLNGLNNVSSPLFDSIKEAGSDKIITRIIYILIIIVFILSIIEISM